MLYTYHYSESIFAAKCDCYMCFHLHILDENTYERVHNDALVKCTPKQDVRKLDDDSFM